MPYVQLFGAQLAIAAAAIFARLALTGAGPLAVSALRMAIAAAVTIAVAFAFARERLGRATEARLAAAGFALAVHFGVWITSLQYTSVAVSTLLVTTTPLFTEGYDALRLRRAPSRRLLAALALAVAGLIPIVAQRDAPAPVPGHGALGAGLALAGAVAFGVYLTIVRVATSSTGAGVSTLAIVARTYGWAAGALVLAALVARQPPPVFGDGRAWFGIAGMALVSQLLGHTGLNAALKAFSPTIVSTTTLLEPVFAALLAALVLRETPGPAAIVGGVLVLAAVGIALTTAPGAESAQAA